MHFFKNSVSFIAVMSVCGVALAAVAPARVGVVANAAAIRRLPSLSNVMKSSAATAATSSSTSGSSTGTGLIDDAECVDNYRDCMKGDNACGSGFEECTTNVLFHGHMSECVSTLYQCSPSAIERLLGTSNLNALSESTTDENGDTNYTYPTPGSIMGVDISGAAIRNKLNTADCVKKYKRCLNKDNICGEDFELCTSKDEFKKQAAMCDSTLARCQKEGFQQLFGEGITTKPSNKKLSEYIEGSDIKSWVDEGAALAAANAVNTCYKVVDTCFANACASNPYSCVEDVNWAVVNAAKSVGIKEVVTMKKDGDKDVVDGKQTATDVRKFFRAACTDTIGANQYCFMTFNDGKKPTKADLQDEDIREDIFGEAYASRKTILTTKVNELVKQFDKTATSKCLETFKSCAVQSCGGGSGAACYSRVFGNSSTEKSINGAKAYSDIENGCAAIVNTDANCQFMAAMQDQDTSGVARKITNVYTSNLGGDYDAFSTLFPEYKEGNADSPIVAALNAELSTAYNDVAIENMKKQCQTLVENCVKSMCGKDYMNCYRNRNDVYASVYNSGNKVKDKEMNKLGGVLDYTIVQGLCASTIRTSDTCAESLAIAKAKLQDGNADVTAGWGSDKTLTNAWRKSASMATLDGMVNDVDANGKRRCECDGNKIDICADESGASDLTCTKPHRVSQSSLWENQAVASLFDDILDMVEREAQAQYNAKLTKEQNVCLAQNTGANPDATFVWAKLKGNLPKDYAAKGLGDKSVESNDLYNSFCRVKVTLQSEDRDLTTLLSGGSIKGPEVKTLGFAGADWLAADESRDISGSGKNESTVYFAAGDAFTCGSWVSEDTLDAMSKKVGAQARKDAGQGSQADKNVKLWTTLGVGTLGTVGSYIGMNALQTNGKSLGGLLTKTSSSSKPTEKQVEAAKQCQIEVNTARDKLVAARNAIPGTADATTKAQELRDAANKALTQARASGIAATGISFSTVQSGTNTYAWSSKHAEIKSKWQTQPSILTGTNIVYFNDVKNFLNSATPETINNGISGSAYSYGELKKVNGFDLPDPKDAYEKVDSSASTLATYETNLNTLASECAKREAEEETDEDRKSRLTNNLVAAGVGGVATTLLTNGIVSSAQKAKYENAENAAVKEWMENIGSKIHCYINGELVGDFGDIVTVNITEN